MQRASGRRKKPADPVDHRNNHTCLTYETGCLDTFAWNSPLLARCVSQCAVDAPRPVWYKFGPHPGGVV
ncbi:MAG: hypothetical protein ABSC61_00775 [Anaerolineales bacterium]